MKFTLVYVIALVALLTNEASAVRDAHFCDGKVQEDGTQIKTGSCSVTVQGDIPSFDKMTSTFITAPENGAILIANTAFDVDVSINNLETGNFNDPEKEYYLEPQGLNDDGVIKGHTHITIQRLLDNNPPDASVFEFFEGLNDKAKDGHFTVNCPGLSAGQYRICTLAGAASHQPVIMPIAKRGAQDDCIRIDVVDTVPDNAGNSTKPSVPKQIINAGNSTKPSVPKRINAGNSTKPSVPKRKN